MTSTSPRGSLRSTCCFAAATTHGSSSICSAPTVRRDSSPGAASNPAFAPLGRCPGNRRVTLSGGLQCLPEEGRLMFIPKCRWLGFASVLRQLTEPTDMAGDPPGIFPHKRPPLLSPPTHPPPSPRPARAPPPPPPPTPPPPP